VFVTPTSSFATLIQKLEFLAASVIKPRHMCVLRVWSGPAVVVRYLTPRNSDITADFLTSSLLYCIDCHWGERHCSKARFSKWPCRFFFEFCCSSPFVSVLLFFVPPEILPTLSSFDVSRMWKMRGETNVTCFKVLLQYGVTEKDLK